MSEFKRLQNPLNSIGDTAVHAHRTKCHKQKQFRRVTVQRALYITVASLALFLAGEAKAEK